jgi:hypothetical protein
MMKETRGGFMALVDFGKGETTLQARNLTQVHFAA